MENDIRIVSHLLPPDSPEYNSEPEIGKHADIYSLGVLSFQLLSGQLPFSNQNPVAIMMAHINQPPPDLRAFNADVSAKTAAAIQKAMAKLPSERFDTASEFVEALTPSN